MAIFYGSAKGLQYCYNLKVKNHTGMDSLGTKYFSRLHFRQDGRPKLINPLRKCSRSFSGMEKKEQEQRDEKRQRM